MSVFNNLSVAEASQSNEIYVVYTGEKHQLTKEQKAKCQEYLNYINNERKEKGLKPLKNGDIYTIVHEQRTPDGKLLLLTEKTDYAHFLAFRDQNTEVVKKIFGNVPIPPCPVANPQTMILAKPESVVAKDAEKGTLGRIHSAMKSRGPRVILGVMGKQTAFEGTAQAFGATLNIANMTKENPENIRENLRNLGFDIRSSTISGEAGIWDLNQITNQSLESQAGITKADLAGDVIPLGVVRDDVGNYYLTSLTPVKKTEREILNKKPGTSKFDRLISVPANPKKAITYLSLKGIDYRVYVPKAIEYVQQMIRNRQNFSDKVAEKIGLTNKRLSSLAQSGKEIIRSTFNPAKIIGRKMGEREEITNRGSR